MPAMPSGTPSTRTDSDGSPKRPGVYPRLGKPAMDRSSLLSLAGLTPEVIAEGVKLAYDVQRALLEAERTEIVQYKGQITEVQVPDNPTRLRAAEAIHDMAGVKPSKQDTQTTITQVVVFNFPEWDEGERGRVIEAEATPVIGPNGD